MSMFNAREVLKTAVTIEANGEKFYTELAGGMKDEKLKRVFLFLAGEEKAHREVFEAQLARAGDLKAARPFYNEYFAYLSAYVDSDIFSFRKLEGKISSLKNILSAVDFALQRELESISYYQEMKIWVPAVEHFFLDRIISEERHHFMKLIQIKRRIR